MVFVNFQFSFLLRHLWRGEKGEDPLLHPPDAQPRTPAECVVPDLPNPILYTPLMSRFRICYVEHAIETFGCQGN